MAEQYYLDLIGRGSVWFIRHSDTARPLRWMGWAVLLHSVCWLGAALIADPQRLILGTPWYLGASLALGWVAAAVWVHLAFAALRGPKALFAGMALFAFYFPFVRIWNLA